jgi:hypothetical protein
LSPDQGATWVQKEFGGADLGAPRLTKRLIKISAKFAGHPGASIPLACETPDRLKAAYRFFDNDHVNELEILEPHRQANKTRMAPQAVVLAVWERPAAECGKKHRRHQRPIQEKESRKWLHSLEKTAQLQAEMPQVHLVNIADREGDIYD